MSARDHWRTGACRVLEEDTELALAIPADRRKQAVGECVSKTIMLPPGRWHPSQTQLQGGIGLLLLDGLVIRRVGVEGTFGAELLGKGDLLRPWQSGEAPTMAVRTGFQVIKRARMAVLHERFAQRIARYPQLTGSLVARALARSRALAVNMAIVHQPRVDVRLHMLFWALAGRWGRTRGETVSLALKLTHNVLSELVAARRETISRALSELEDKGLVQTVDEGWLLFRAPPAELLELVDLPQKPRGRGRYLGDTPSA